MTKRTQHITEVIVQNTDSLQSTIGSTQLEVNQQKNLAVLVNKQSKYTRQRMRTL